MKRTAFYDIHVACGGKIVPFGGYEMPVQYPSGIIAEHKCVRTGVGVFDVSHMGEFEVRGKDALAFLQKMTVNDVSKLSEGKVQYSAMCYEDGGIVDDLLVYHRGDHYMLVVNAANIDKDFAWLKDHITGDVQMTNESDKTSLLAIQGPKAYDTLKRLCDVDIAALGYYTFTEGTVAAVPMIISRTGYTGEKGFEIYFEASTELAKHVWDALMHAGKEFGIQPIGLGARDTLRLEMGYMLYGNDIDQTTSTIEAGLGWITKIDKGDFIGKARVVNDKQNPKRRLAGIMFDDVTAIARHGYKVMDGANEIGVVTSGTISPMLNKPIGMAYVPVEKAKAGNTVEVAIRGKNVKANIVKMPVVNSSPQ
ncbi:MAG TPA: glycine cleavage system aminomethyltransferase GcvT [Candidatus Kapabacteria bacterium]|nr:glycine cleavage system aminomethyltransferase GcvT [Candidatus Kapabacteria bacterium]